MIGMHHPWQTRHIVLWLAITGTFLWWRGPAFRQGFDIQLGGDPLPDFFQDWTSARNVHEGLPVYTPHDVTVKRYLGFGHAPAEIVTIDRNAHPPASVLVAMPFGVMSFPTALAVWNALSLLLLGASLLLLADGLRVPICEWDVLPALSLLLVCRPFWHQTMHGQWNLVLLILVTGMWWADRNGWSRLAGVALGTAAAIKLFPAYLFLYFFWSKKWLTIFWGLGALAILTALCCVVLGPAEVTRFFVEVLPHTARWRTHFTNLSLPGIWAKLFDPADIRPGEHARLLYAHSGLALAGIVLIMAAITAALHRWVAPLLQRQDSDAAFSLTVMAMLLASPLTWDHYLLLMALPLAVLWLRLPKGGPGRELLVLLLAILWLPPRDVMEHCLILLGNSSPNPGSGQYTPWEALLAVSVPAYALAGTFALAGWSFVKAGAAERTGTAA
jgi:hypothetical protein